MHLSENVSQMSPSLGVWTFFASAHAIDVCGVNGLPLTPNSIHVLGRFQKLKLIKHSNLCSYVDVQRGKHERVMIVSEYYQDNLNVMKVPHENMNKFLLTVSLEILDAISYLHSLGIVHRCLSPNCIRFDSQCHVKISNFGLYYMTEGGSAVSFPIGYPKYMAPEILGNGLCDTTSSAKCDMWSIGIILLELSLEITLWRDFELEDVFKEIIALLKCDNGASVISSIVKSHDCSFKYGNLPEMFCDLLEQCLNPDPTMRPEAHDLLAHHLFVKWKNLFRRISDVAPESKTAVPSLKFLCTKLRCDKLSTMKCSFIATDHLSQRTLEEIYYLWRLAGGDLEAELRRQELIRAKSSILSLPKVISNEGVEFGHEKDIAFLLDDSIVILPLEPLRYRLRDIDWDAFFPLTEYSLNDVNISQYNATLSDTAKLPIVIKEKDVEYQFHRIVLFKKLLEAYPFKRSQILHEARTDIAPLYRSYIWAALLEVEGDILVEYDTIDKETSTATDRQIEVDIPRCHQYDELLSSPIGHKKFKRILKAWVVSHPQYVYWQGLDSLCAPFLSLNFSNEALAYACLSSFISKYLYDFFLKDNSAVIQEYLAKFSHLIAFHDPELTNHLDSIGFIPELYSIPWFLTMYTHVFPLHKIFHLWDTLLLGHSSVPLFIAVAILNQLRNNLLSYGFNECILMFSDMPEINIQRCVQDSIKLFCSTPKSITFRVHENKKVKQSDVFQTSFKFSKTDNTGSSEFEMSAIPLHELKSETCPRISAEDLLDLMELLPDQKNKMRSQSIKLLAIDVRNADEYCKGALIKSINVPFSTAFSQDGALDSFIIQSYKGKIIIVMGTSKDNLASQFATKLVRLGFCYVCTLHGGVEVLRKSGFLIAKTLEG